MTDTLHICVNDESNYEKYEGIKWTNITVPVITNETNGNDLQPIINGFPLIINNATCKHSITL